MKFKRTVLSVSIATAISTLTACGGGGGGGGGTMGAIVRPDVPFYSPQRINGYTPINTTTYTSPITEIFTKDLNRDGSDEVVISAVAFGGTPTTWKDANLQIFGFNTGAFKNETTTWFTGTDNRYTGGTTVKFGDFNRDGHLDMFVASFTDSNHYTPSTVFFNTGNNKFTRSTIDFGEISPHDSIVTDLNGDGYADIFLPDIGRMKPAVAFGSASGTFSIYRSDIIGGGAGVSVADYLGNGTKTIILTDAAGTGNHDTKLYSWNIVAGKLVLTEIGTLPADRFYLSKWDSVRASTTLAPHAVRNITMDFNNDGRPDVIVFSTMPKNGNVHGYSEVQFLKNNGGGSFTDVTDTVLAKYNNNKTTTYNPQLIDVNNDGLVDILISATDYTGQASTSVLLNTVEGKFVESYTQVFTDFANQIKGLTVGGTQNQSIAIVAGPNNKRYLMSGVEYVKDGVPQIAVYLSLIGSTGTVTAPATVATLQQAWPWMTSAQANSALQQSVSQWVDGIPVIDLERLFQPIGNLSIPVNGKLSPLSGSIGGISLNGSANQIKVVDSIGRDFNINYSNTNYYLANQWSRMVDSIDDDTRGAQLSGLNFARYNGFKFAGTEDNRYVALGVTGIDLSKNISLSVQYSRLPFSPFVQLNGSWGLIKSSNTFESTLTARHNEVVTKFGIMYSSTEIEPGIVNRINPITSVWAEAGYEWTNVRIYGGFLPKVISGSADITLPTGVDFTGRISYTSTKADVYSPTVTYARISYSDKIKKNITYRINGIITNQQQHNVIADIKISF